MNWINLNPNRPIPPVDSAAIDYAKAYAIPIAFGAEMMPIARKPNFASCAIVASDEHQWILTAWHVLREIVEELRNPGSICHIGFDPENPGEFLAAIQAHDIDGVSYSERLDIATLQAPPWLVELVDRSERFRVVRPRRWPLLPRVRANEPVYLGGYPKSLTTRTPVVMSSGMSGKLFTVMRTGFGFRVRSAADDQFICGAAPSQTTPEELPLDLDVGGLSGGPVFVDRNISGVHQFSLCGVVKEGGMFDGRWLGTLACGHTDSVRPDGSIDEDAPRDLSGGLVRVPIAPRF